MKKRKKKLPKAVFGTSHTISKEEAADLFERNAEKVIVGTGQSGCAELSAEADAFFRQKECETVVLPTPQAADAWNTSTGRLIGLFHVTC